MPTLARRRSRPWPPLRGGCQESLIFDWGSVPPSIGHSLRQPLRAATSLKEGAKGAARRFPPTHHPWLLLEEKLSAKLTDEVCGTGFRLAATVGESVTRLTPLRGYTSSAPFGGTFSSRRRLWVCRRMTDPSSKGSGRVKTLPYGVMYRLWYRRLPWQRKKENRCRFSF